MSRRKLPLGIVSQSTLNGHIVARVSSFCHECETAYGPLAYRGVIIVIALGRFRVHTVQFTFKGGLVMRKASTCLGIVALLACLVSLFPGSLRAQSQDQGGTTLTGQRKMTHAEFQQAFWGYLTKGRSAYTKWGPFFVFLAGRSG